MILEALQRYYVRRSASADASIAPPGLAKQRIPFVIVLDNQGKFVDLEDTREPDGAFKQGRSYTVPQGVKRSSGIKANLLWDNLNYVLGYDAKVRERHNAFIKNIQATLPHAKNDAGLESVISFLSHGDYSTIYKHPVWAEVKKSSGYLSFRLEADSNLVCQRLAVNQAVLDQVIQGEKDKTASLVGGERNENSDTTARPGLEMQCIPFVIVLDNQGKFVNLEDTRETNGTFEQGRIYAVPKGIKRSAEEIKANLLWDNLNYVLGYDAKVEERHSDFIKKLQTTLMDCQNDVGLNAVTSFLSNANYSAIYEHPVWPEVLKNTGFLSFRLKTDNELVCQRSAVIECVTNPSPGFEDGSAICLVTGERDEIAKLHTAIKNVYGAQSSGGNIVSFNLQAFESYGRKQGLNAPIGKRAMFAYTTALNELLDGESKQQIHVGDASIVFWSEKKSSMEILFPELMGEGTKDDPGRRTESIKALYSSPKTGTKPLEDDETKFYVLALAPNAARISIRFWRVDTVSKLAKNLRQYFDDISVVGGPNDEKYPSIYRMLTATAVLGDGKNILPNMAGEFLQAILSGRPFPRTLLAAAIRRLHTGEHINHTIVALVKGYLLRFDRFQKNKEEELTVALDESNTNQGYRLGRLFAVLERVQELASPGLNATIRDRYYGAASSTPCTVFPILLRLKNHHISKLENRGAAVNLEKIIGQIMQTLEGFPSHLGMPDQGRFAVGYYHQRQQFFASKEKVEKIEQTAGV